MAGALLVDFTLQQIVLRLCALLLLMAVHGAAVAATACALGDPGPRYDGRLSLDPLAHVDLLGLLCGVLFSIGWIKPVAIDPDQLRLRRGGLVVVVVAAAAAVLAAAFGLLKLRPLLLPLFGDSASALAFALIETIGQLGVWLALVNVLPLPPLTGSHLLTALVPSWRAALRRTHIPAALLLTALAAAGTVTGVLAPVDRMLARLL